MADIYSVTTWDDVDDRYKVRILGYHAKPEFDHRRPRLMITALTPPEWVESVSSRWQAPLEALGTGFRKGRVGVKAAVAAVAKVAGAETALAEEDWSVLNKAVSRQYWMGNTPLELTLPLIFIAMDDAYLDVVEPARALQGLCLARDATRGFLDPPDSVTIDIGYLLRLKEALIKVVDIKWITSQLDKWGNPLRAEVTVKVSSREVYVLDTDEHYKAPPVGGWDYIAPWEVRGTARVRA